MRSIRDIYKIGKGPSSSHTMGPERAAQLFKREHPNAEQFRVVLYDSLAKTGVGHGCSIPIRWTFLQWSRALNRPGCGFSRWVAVIL